MLLRRGSQPDSILRQWRETMTQAVVRKKASNARTANRPTPRFLSLFTIGYKLYFMFLYTFVESVSVRGPTLVLDTIGRCAAGRCMDGSPTTECDPNTEAAPFACTVLPRYAGAASDAVAQETDATASVGCVFTKGSYRCTRRTVRRTVPL
jgi:hypothetical protein